MFGPAAIAVVLSGMLAGLTAGGSSVAAVADSGAEQPVRVMPMGSSTVAGSTPGGFRVDLWQLLVAEGWPVDFVGSMTDTRTPIGDPDHEGHGGYRIDQMAAEVVGWVTAAQPDIVLLHAGANDVLQNYQLSTAPARLGALIDQILDTRHGTKIYVSTVGPVNKADVQARANAFNAAIPGVVAERFDRGDPVYLVDNAAALQLSDVRNDPNGDFYHLTHSGNAKLAVGWYAALTSSRPRRYEAEDPSHTTLNHASVLNTPNASEYRKVGKIDLNDSYLQFRIDLPESATYRMFVRGGNGMGRTCTHKVAVNGRTPLTMTYAPYGWENWTITSLDLPLTGSTNTIRFTHDTCYAEIDSIYLVEQA
ncbi:GDSL-type esterase/lipase family protein [Flindersiella endophytica]